MGKGYFHRVAELMPTKIWIDNATRKEAQMAIDAGAVMCAQNPSYTWKMISHLKIFVTGANYKFLFILYP